MTQAKRYRGLKEFTKTSWMVCVFEKSGLSFFYENLALYYFVSRFTPDHYLPCKLNVTVGASQISSGKILKNSIFKTFYKTSCTSFLIFVQKGSTSGTINFNCVV